MRNTCTNGLPLERRQRNKQQCVMVGTLKSTTLSVNLTFGIADGVTRVEDRQYMIMEDVCRGYKQPCVIDAKIGFSSLYTWADEKYQKKVM